MNHWTRTHLSSENIKDKTHLLIRPVNYVKCNKCFDGGNGNTGQKGSLDKGGDGILQYLWDADRDRMMDGWMCCFT